MVGGGALALAAGCASLGNPPASEKDDALYATSRIEPDLARRGDRKNIPTIRRPTISAARCTARPGSSEQALADFNKAISLDPKYAQAYANRALVYRKTDKLDLALADDNKALAIDAAYAPAGRLRPAPVGARRKVPISRTAAIYHAADAMRTMYDMGDAPSCNVCGAIMVRNGSCYRCMSCGSTSGCS